MPQLKQRASIKPNGQLSKLSPDILPHLLQVDTYILIRIRISIFGGFFASSFRTINMPWARTSILAYMF